MVDRAEEILDYWTLSDYSDGAEFNRMQIETLRLLRAGLQLEQRAVVWCLKYRFRGSKGWYESDSRDEAGLREYAHKVLEQRGEAKLLWRYETPAEEWVEVPL